MRQKIGFFMGPVLFAALLLFPSGNFFSGSSKAAAGVAIWMAVWWVTEAVPLAATSLMPLAVYPLLGILSMEETAKRYADPNIFLFMGGFMLALAMQKCGLHKRIALSIILAVGDGRRRMLGGFLVATALISMWVSNTATCLMVLPIGLAVSDRLSEGGRREIKGFDTALMLAIAYASSIGGVATLIGSPPNMILVGQVKNLFPQLPEISFVTWFIFAAPLAAGFLFITWAYLSLRLVQTEPSKSSEPDAIRQEFLSLGKVTPSEARVAFIFFLTVLGWIFRTDIELGKFRITGWATLLGLKGTHDAMISILAALFLFVTPSRAHDNGRLLDWEWAKKIPWEVLILFGGGFALAESFQCSGLTQNIAGVFHGLHGIPLFWLILCLCLLTTFLSELMSNTAQVMILLPILAATATSLGIHPLYLLMPAVLAASLAFMMPVGTPPNAIVFGSGRVTMPQMAKTGFILNLLSSLWITLYCSIFLKYMIA